MSPFRLPLAGVVAVYVVLLLLFHSATLPLVILAAVPLCGGGAFGMLLLTGNALSLPSLIGLLLLTGIATKNSILIVEYANQRVARGIDVIELRAGMNSLEDVFKDLTGGRS